ncbi:MAG: NrfD/PsrC family molybdoenzyme membrane anchor subunit, partial [Raoultibacter sp.]
AASFVVIDLGNPLRLWELIVFSNMTSPLMWDIFVITAYLILSVFYLVMMIRSEKGKVSQTALRAVSTVALILAVLVHSVTAWIFALQNGHDMWNTAIMAPWFVSSALVSGLALVMVVVIALRKVGYLELDSKYLVKMGKFLGVFCCIDLFFFGCDLLTEAFPGGHSADIATMIMFGPLAPFFWTEVIGCAIAIAVGFIPSLRRPSLYVVAGVGAMIAIFCKRCQIILGGFTPKNIDLVTAAPTYPLTDLGAQIKAAIPSLVYFPTPLEFMVVIAMCALGVAALVLGLRFLPLKPTENTH